MGHPPAGIAPAFDHRHFCQCPGVMANDSEVKTFTVDVTFGSRYFQNSVDPGETAQKPFCFFSRRHLSSRWQYLSGRHHSQREKPILIRIPPEPSANTGLVGPGTIDLAAFERAAAKDHDAAPDMGFATEMFSLLQMTAESSLPMGTLPNAYFSARRVLVGGSAGFRKMVEEVHEQNIGENKLGFCNLRVTFVVLNARGRSYGLSIRMFQVRTAEQLPLVF